MELSFSIDNIPEAGAWFLRALGDRKVIAFHGEMGAGKTTFILAVCSILQVGSRTSSPTFSIINEYRYPLGVLYHMDLYRIKDEEEAIRAGVEDALYSGNICMVEWPQRAAAIFPENAVHVTIEAVDEHTRRIIIKDK
ncbi:MAG: tRNA (adenosine(37)-N6)-threonylcarbamoyltransferase complex ATPase subunit type 1 TsaE [Chitinophagaceae bacterium]|nr:tRNA (adenosine(37)-N6)-threonylcarbamoyltransferase complex ATPase subunit type 1 TsaE [Chitinophagaceae bacterium]